MSGLVHSGASASVPTSSDLQIMLRLDALGAGNLRAFATDTQEPSIGLSINAEIRDGAVLRSTCGYGESFSVALADLWAQLTPEDRKLYVVVNAGRETRRAVRWNGAGWKPVYEPDRAVPATGASS